MTLPDLNATAKQYTAPWSKGIDVIQKDLRTVADLAKKLGTIKITADLSGAKKPLADLDTLRQKASAPIKIGANGEGLRDVNRIIRDTSKSIDGIRNAWRLEAVTNEEATLAAKRHRDELLKLAAAEDTNAEAILKAVKAAAQAQNLMNQAQGKPTRGGFAFNASLGIIDALQNLGGPAGAAAGMIGQFITQGLTQGMERGSKGVEAEALELSDDVIQAIKKKLQIQSPSKVMEQVGQFIVQGLINGFKSDTNTLLNTVRGVGAQIPMAFKAGASGGGMGGTAKELGGLGDAADDLTPKMTKATQGIEGVMNGAEALTVALAPVVAATLTFGAALAVSVPKAAEFEKALKNIAAESDLTSSDLVEIGQGLLKVSDDIGVSSIALAKASYDIVGAAVQGAETNGAVVQLARQSAQLAGAGMTDVAVAADVLTSALNAYGYSAVNAEHVSDVLFQTTNAGKISIAQMGGTMNEVFPLAAKLGVDLENLGGSIAGLTSVGVPAAQAVTGIQGVLTNILRPSESATAAAHELGIGFDAATLKAKGFNVFLNDLAKAVGGNTAIMGELFEDVNAINAVFALTSDVGAKKFTEALQKMAQANGSTAQGYAEVAASYSHATEKFQTSVENLQIIFATKYLPTITKGIDATSKFVQNLDEFGQNGVVQFALFAGGAAIAFNAVTKLRIAVNALAGGTALTTAVANFGGIGAAIAALTADVATLGLVGAGAAAAMAPMLTLALGIGAAFAGWKIGQWIGDLKLFGDTTTTVNDKLTDFFATTLFGADPKAIKEMRAMEEAEQRRAQAAGESADEYAKAANAIKAQAAAEREAIKAEQAAAAAREAQLQLIREQKAAIDDLNKALSDRKFKLSLEGKTNLQKDLAEIGKTFDDLAAKLEKPFMVGDKLQSTPALEAARKDLEAQRKAELAAARSTYADDAVKAAKDFALKVQAAEISALKEGRAKKAAERKLEIEELQRANQEEADKYKEFPEQYKQIVSDGQQAVAALKKKHRQEDIATAEDHAKRIKEAETRAAQSVLETMQDGYAKQELARRLALDQLKSDIAERVKALEGDPATQAKVKSEGQKEINNRIQADNMARLKEVQDAQAAIRDAEQAGADARVAALADGFAKEEALRAQALVKLKESYRRRIEAEKGRPDVQKALMGERDDAVASLEMQNAQARTAAIKAGNDAVYEAQKAARTAEIALIKDDLAKKQASQNEELTDLQRSIQKKLDGFKGTEEQRRKILEAGQAQVRDLNKKHLQEDADDARERAQRIADAWNEVRSKQFAAQAAGRARELAQFEADAAARQRTLSEQPVAQAQASANDVSRRFALQREASVKQFTWEEQQAAYARDKSLRAENLTAEQKKIIWAEYNATLKKLGEDRAADETRNLSDEVAAARAARDALRAAYLTESNKPIQRSQNRVQELQWAKDLSRSDAEILRLNQDISAERGKQIQALQDQLIGLGGVVLTTEQRQQVEQQIKQLQQDQAVAVRDQEEAQRRLRNSALDRLDTEAQLAERTARSSDALLAAQRQQLAVAQARIRALDGEIAGERREEQRNALLSERYGLLGRIYDLTEKINAAPLDAEQRRLDVYKAQAKARLSMGGRGNDDVAQAKLTTELAARDLALVNRRVALGGTEAQQQQNLIGQAEARVTLMQALTAQQELQTRSITKASQVEQERLNRVKELASQESLLGDAAEARSRAEETLRSFGGDAVLAAERALKFTRERARLMAGMLKEETNPANRADILQRQLQLIGQEIEQERTLYEAQRARASLTLALQGAEAALTATTRDGTGVAGRLADANRKVAESRATLARAEQDYANARYLAERHPGDATANRYREATDALTAAIRNSRSAVQELAGEYRGVISQMDGVREASDRLRTLVQGEKGGSTGAELARLDAIQKRRDAAMQSLRTTLERGDKASIQRAITDLANQEERYRKQAKLLEDRGVTVQLKGESSLKNLVQQLDALGLSLDREAGELTLKADVADQEARTAERMYASADLYAHTTDLLVTRLAETAKLLNSEWDGAQQYASRQAAAVNALNAGPDATSATPALRLTAEALDKVAARLGGDLPLKIELPKMPEMSVSLTPAAMEALRLHTPATQPAPQLTQHNNFYATINATSDKTQDIKRAAREVFQEVIDDAKREKSWGTPCR